MDHYARDDAAYRIAQAAAHDVLRPSQQGKTVLTGDTLHKAETAHRRIDTLETDTRARMEALEARVLALEAQAGRSGNPPPTARKPGIPEGMPDVSTTLLSHLQAGVANRIEQRQAAEILMSFVEWAIDQGARP